MEEYQDTEKVNVVSYQEGKLRAENREGKNVLILPYQTAMIRIGGIIGGTSKNLDDILWIIFDLKRKY